MADKDEFVGAEGTTPPTDRAIRRGAERHTAQLPDTPITPDGVRALVQRLTSDQ